MSYDPRKALKLYQGIRPKLVPRGTPTEAVRTREGELIYQTKPRADSVCFTLLQFVQSANMPEDFHNVDKASKPLKAHVRPDGGVYLGSFEPPAFDGIGVIVVFGDTLTSPEEAAKLSLWFRRTLKDGNDQTIQSPSLGQFSAPASTQERKTVS